jgi:dihydropyrimidinase
VCADLVVKGGQLVTPEGTFKSDLAVTGDTIADIGQGLKADSVLDATGCWVVPGGVDPHVHLQMPTATTISSDDWHSGTVAAAHGGTTTVIDFVEPKRDQSLLDAYLARRHQAEGSAAVDFGMHMTVTSDDHSVLDQLPSVIEAGLPTFKLYTTYDGFRLDDRQLLDVLTSLRSLAALPIVHAESDAIIGWKTESLLREAPDRPSSHPLSRPPEAEVEAIQRVLALAETVGVGIYFVHVSTAGGAEAIQRAKTRGQAVHAETCPQYLLLSDDLYRRPGFEGAKYVCSPPLRDQDQSSVLWNSLRSGVLDVVATDHCPYFLRGQKDLGKATFTDIPGGLPGVELRLSLLYSHGVHAGRITVEQWVERCSTGPARLFGLYPRKGVLAVGSDADLVIYDPSGTRRVSHTMLHENVDYTPYEGISLAGGVRTVVLRGQILVEQGEFVGPSRRGSFLKRAIRGQQDG